MWIKRKDLYQCETVLIERLKTETNDLDFQYLKGMKDMIAVLLVRDFKKLKERNARRRN